ncbi:MAG: hypothetical protein NT094_01515, partial [Candidatus Staskawiczbacteria bacterium]|nr:hypothetical protein [Candidatus Staskawiczbacteria bacterium]
MAQHSIKFGPLHINWEWGFKPGKNAWYGWKPDVPDHRDFFYTRATTLSAAELPKTTDLRNNFPQEPYSQDELGSCHDDKTEVLTENGWKMFSDISKLDKLASVDPET